MADNAEYGVLKAENKEDRLTKRRIPKIEAEIRCMYQKIVSYTVFTTALLLFI
jgi:hypothetical protein